MIQSGHKATLSYFLANSGGTNLEISFPLKDLKHFYSMVTSHKQQHACPNPGKSKILYVKREFKKPYIWYGNFV